MLLIKFLALIQQLQESFGSSLLTSYVSYKGAIFIHQLLSPFLKKKNICKSLEEIHAEGRGRCVEVGVQHALLKHTHTYFTDTYGQKKIEIESVRAD